MNALTRYDAAAPLADSADTLPVLHVVFKVGTEEYILPYETVVQIESFTGATLVPGAPRFVAGIVQIRGRVVPVIDMRERFGLGAAESNLDCRIVVGQHGERLVGLKVDSAREVLKIPLSALKPPPRIVDDASGGFIKAVGQVGPRLLMLIDFAKVIGEEMVDAG
jgi:purine-binding chemotaxis protein CheW